MDKMQEIKGHKLTVSPAEPKSTCECGDQFPVSVEGFKAWRAHSDIQRLLPHIRKAALREIQARAEVEELITELVKLGASSYVVQVAIGNKDDGTPLISTSSIQRIAKSKMVQKPRRRRR